MRDKRLINTRCPTCGKSLDAAGMLAGVDDIPDPEDLTVCLYCSSVAQFQADMSLKHVPESDYACFDAKNYAGIMHIRFAIDAAKSKSKSKSNRDKNNKFFTEEMLNHAETRFKQDRHKDWKNN